MYNDLSFDTVYAQDEDQKGNEFAQLGGGGRTSRRRGTGHNRVIL